MRSGRSCFSFIDRLLDDNENIRHEDLINKEANYNINKMVIQKMNEENKHNNGGLNKKIKTFTFS